MKINEAQREVRNIYLGAFPGFIITSIIWFLSAAAGTWRSTSLAILILVLGGTFIFPLSQVLLKIMGRATTLSKENPFGMLAMQIAFTIPATYPLIAGATIHNINWFFPAFLVVVGAHYLPFIFLYGMWQFAILSGLLIGIGTVFGLYFQDSFSLGGWVGAAIFFAFAFPFRSISLRADKETSA